jgi:hypothetical protein
MQHTIVISSEILHVFCRCVRCYGVRMVEVCLRVCVILYALWLFIPFRFVYKNLIAKLRNHQCLIYLNNNLKMPQMKRLSKLCANLVKIIV